MENKELYKVEIGTKVDEMELLENGFKFKFDDKEYSITTHHDSDCCESAWGDFSVLKYQIDLIKGKYQRSLVLKAVDGIGFLVCFDDVKVFIPCYSSNNGYYSDNLWLNIETGNTNTKIDIRDLHEDK